MILQIRPMSDGNHDHEQTPLLAEASYVSSSASGEDCTRMGDIHREMYDNVPQSKRQLGWSRVGTTCDC